MEIESTKLGNIRCDCNTLIPLMVHKSAAGYYIGHVCPNCGPYDRISGYFPTQERAEAEMSEMQSSTETRPA